MTRTLTANGDVGRARRPKSWLERVSHREMLAKLETLEHGRLLLVDEDFRLTFGSDAPGGLEATIFVHDPSFYGSVALEWAHANVGWMIYMAWIALFWWWLFRWFFREQAEEEARTGPAAPA